MERVTISSSIKFKDQIRAALSRFEEVGVEASFPNLDTGVVKENVDVLFMRRLEDEHFESIDESEALYVICPKGYVGTLVSVEIGYAHAQKKPVIFSEKPEDLGLQALATSYVPLEKLQIIKELDSRGSN